MRQMMKGRNLRLETWMAGLGFLLFLSASVPVSAQQQTTDTESYCSGFFTTEPLENGLHLPQEDGLKVLGSEDAGEKNEYTVRDFLYLNHGRDALATPGGLYLLVRPVLDFQRDEAFAGQRELLEQMGSLYAEIGRIEVKILHPESATVEVLGSCEPVLTGDIAIPLDGRPPLDLKSPKETDRFAPSSGKAIGTLVAGKELDRTLGEGKIGYVNIGSNDGVTAGSYLRIVRYYSGGLSEDFENAVRNYSSTDIGWGSAQPLTVEQRATLPREVLGEMVVLSARPGSATALITYSRKDVIVGDGVELE